MASAHSVPCQPWFALDVVAAGLLPEDWLAQVLAAARAPERIAVQTGVAPKPEDDIFSILPGPAVRARLGWLWELYLGPLRAFASESFGRPLYVANRVSSAMTLNILDGIGAEQAWHADSNAVTGVFYATTHAGEAGALELRDSDGSVAQFRPRAGMFVCLRGHLQHRVVPLDSRCQRLSFALLYYDSPTDQPFASADDRHEMSAQ